MTLIAGADYAERNKRALERAVADGVTIRIEGGELTDTGYPTLAEVYADKEDGTSYTVWATAGSYIDGGPGYLVAFACQCKGGSRTSYGITVCKHEAALAPLLVQSGLVQVDRDGCYRTTPEAGTVRNSPSGLISIPTLMRQRELKIGAGPKPQMILLAAMFDSHVSHLEDPLPMHVSGPWTLCGRQGAYVMRRPLPGEYRLCKLCERLSK